MARANERVVFAVLAAAVLLPALILTAAALPAADACAATPRVHCSKATPAAVLLRQPQAVAWDGDRLLIADSGNARVLAGASGAVQVVAGTGLADSGPQSGSARTTELALPLALSPNEDGSVLIADSGNHEIRRLLADGRMATVAGSGQR